MDDLKAKFGRAAFRVARTSGGGWLVALVTRYAPRLLPGVIEVHQFSVRQRHPSPVMPGHELLLPRGRIADFTAKSDAIRDFLSELDQRDFGSCEFHLVTNLGVRQDVRLLHIHVFPRAAAAGEWTPAGSLVACHAATVQWSVASLESQPRGGSVRFRPGSDTGWEWSVDAASS